MRRFLPLLLLPLSASALQLEPWFGNVFEFDLKTTYGYSRYTKVQSAKPQFKHPSNDQLVAFDLGLPVSESWAFDMDLEFVNTPRQSWGYRSAGLQARYLCLDDVVGDSVSLAMGLDIRAVSTHSLRDVSCPYHAQFNTELTAALGKEWDQGAFWRFRPFLFASVGIANRGAPWSRLIAMFQGNVCDKHQYKFFANSYWGFGGKKTVHTKRFDGYANIGHQSIDLGAGYRYLFAPWGSLSLDYSYRVFARSFPQRVNAVLLSYEIPFSLF